MPDYKFGLNPSSIDVRNFQFANILSATVPLPPLPEPYELDQKLSYVFTESLFGNDKYGDCVIAERANHTLRFEYRSQKKQIPITTQDCLNEYWLEQGYVPPKCWLQRATSTPPDKGLSLLNSLKTWRSNGWIAGGQRYDIYAFLQISVGNNWWNSTDPTLLQVIARDDYLLKQAIYLLGGASVAVMISPTTMNQFNAGQTWDLTDPVDEKSIGNHCIFLEGFNQTGFLAYTWGKRVQLTWRFWHKYCEEAFCVVDNKDAFLPNDPIDIALLKSYLDALAAG